MANEPQKALFCEKCTSISTPDTPGDISTINGVGRMFYGGADPCEACGSVTRTLWLTFGQIPLVPLGSYRYKTSEESVNRSRFWCRKTSMHWPQVFKTWIIGLLSGAAIITAVVFWDRYKHR